MRLPVYAKHIGLVLVLFVVFSMVTIFSGPGTVHAAPQKAASVLLPRSFHEISEGTTYQWNMVSDGYWNTGQGRVDSGTWTVRQLTAKGYVDIGNINVGVNTYSLGNGHNEYAMDTTTNIHGVDLKHETIINEFPARPSSLDSESAWGTGVRHKAGRYTLETPLPDAQDNNANEHSISTTKSSGLQMYRNGLHLLNEENSSYRKLETDNGLYPAPHAATVAQGVHPAVLPAGVLILAAVGVVLAASGGVISAACGQKFCGKHSRTWAMVGGILVAIGTICTIISGVSVTGWIIAARAEQAPAAAAAAAAAAAEREVELGSVYASARTSFEVPADIAGAFAPAQVRP